MIMDTPLVSIVVLNWNGLRFIDDFMKGVQAQTYPENKIELLFTDNGSVDGSVAYFKKKYGKDSRFKVVLNGKNFGYSGGNNLGIKQSRGDYVLVANNDLELDKNAIVELVKSAQVHDADVAAAKLIYLNKPGIINNAGSRLDTRSVWPVYEIGANDKNSAKYSKDYQTSAFCGACFLARRDFLETVGLFDRHFFMYFEDGDLSWRGMKQNKKYYLSANAIALHVHTGSSKEGSPLFNHFVGRNRLLILTKNGSLLVLSKAWAKTFQDHFIFRLKRLWHSLKGDYPRKLALKEFWLSQKMIWAALLMTPYALAKRYHLINEERL